MKRESSARGPSPAVDAYIAKTPRPVQPILRAVRATIRRAAPDAVEKMAYGIPTFHLHRNLVHFAAWKEHVGFYPGSEGIAEFAPQLARYETSRGAVRFPLDEPMPLALIARIVRRRAEEERARMTRAPTLAGGSIRRRAPRSRARSRRR